MLKNKLCLVLCLLSLCSGAALGLEKYSLCVYDVKIEAPSLSGEAAAKLQKGISAYFKSKPEFKVVSAKELKDLVAGTKVNEADLAEAAKIAGIDLLVNVEIKGKPKADAELEELFEGNSGSNIIMIKTVDLAHGGEAKEASVLVKNNDFKKALADLLLKYEYPFKKGAAIKVRGAKVAISLGEKDGVREGQTVTFYSNLEKEKLAESTILRVGKEVSLSEAEGVKEGDLAEVYVDKSVEVMTDNSLGAEPRNLGALNVNDSPKLEKLSAGQAVSKKGSLSAGFEIGWPFYGINLTYWPGEHGIGLNYYQSSVSNSSKITHLSLKYYYSLNNDAYFSFGLGKYTDTNQYSFRYINDSYYSFQGLYEETIWGMFLGVKPNEYFSLEFGYGSRTAQNGETSGMVTIATGVHFTII